MLSSPSLSDSSKDDGEDDDDEESVTAAAAAWIRPEKSKLTPFDLWRCVRDLCRRCLLAFAATSKEIDKIDRDMLMQDVSRDACDRVGVFQFALPTIWQYR